MLQETAQSAPTKMSEQEEQGARPPPASAIIAQTVTSAGTIHIHDLEYFGTRPFCQDWDLRYFFYYGLMPDGNGTKASVAGPANRAEVAVLHAVKALGSAQTNYAGGQGYSNFLTFLATYFTGMEYIEMNQHMRIFV